MKSASNEKVSVMCWSLGIHRFSMERGDFKHAEQVAVKEYHPLQKAISGNDFSRLKMNIKMVSLDERCEMAIVAREIVRHKLTTRPPTHDTLENITRIYLGLKTRRALIELVLADAIAIYINMAIGHARLDTCPNCGEYELISADARRAELCARCQSNVRPATVLAYSLVEQGAKKDILNHFAGDYLGNVIHRRINKDSISPGCSTGRSNASQEWFIETPTRRMETVSLANLLCNPDIGLMDDEHDVKHGMVFLSCYLTFVKMAEKRTIDINRAFNLLQKIRTSTMLIGQCSRCTSSIININTRVADPLCPACEMEKRNGEPGRRPDSSYFRFANTLRLAS